MMPASDSAMIFLGPSPGSATFESSPAASAPAALPIVGLIRSAPRPRSSSRWPRQCPGYRPGRRRGCELRHCRRADRWRGRRCGRRVRKGFSPRSSKRVPISARAAAICALVMQKILTTATQRHSEEAAENALVRHFFPVPLCLDDFCYAAMRRTSGTAAERAATCKTISVPLTKRSVPRPSRSCRPMRVMPRRSMGSINKSLTAVRS